MLHIGRTHRISIAWLHEQLKTNEVKMNRADSELMAADIFTKPFPEAKASVWRNNLQLINVFDSAFTHGLSYIPSTVRSLRGDLDKPKVTPIDKADLGPEDDDATAVCPTDDEGYQSGFDDSQWNDEWSPTVTADWTQDFELKAAPCLTDVFHECSSQFHDAGSWQL